YSSADVPRPGETPLCDIAYRRLALRKLALVLTGKSLNTKGRNTRGLCAGLARTLRMGWAVRKGLMRTGLPANQVSLGRAHPRRIRRDGAVHGPRPLGESGRRPGRHRGQE